jgi:homoserine acetyltransferase
MGDRRKEMSSKFASLINQHIYVVPSFTLECGTTLRDVPVAYKTWGTLNQNRDNVMVICHAFTGSADVEDWCVIISNHGFVPKLNPCSKTQVGSNDGLQEGI